MADPTKRMDRAEIARRVERAEKLLQKGKTGDALDEYLQVLSDDPQNDNVRQMAADLCLSLQRTADAIALLGELFERQLEAGENTRASLTYKKLARYATPTTLPSGFVSDKFLRIPIVNWRLKPTRAPWKT